MANLRDIKRRIGTVRNTRQITRAMKLVAGAKLRRAQERAEQARPYARSLNRVLGRVAASAGGDVTHPLLTQHEAVDEVVVVVMGSDRGLCGSFNNALFRKTVYFCEDLTRQGRKVSLRIYGKKAKAFFASRPWPVVQEVIDLHSDKYVDLARELAQRLTADFTSGAVQEVYLAYNDFRSVMVQTPIFPRVLPLSIGTTEDADAPDTDYMYEPDGQQLIDTLLPLQLHTTLLQALLETEAGEQASRMTAMDSATRNASELIDSLTLEYNRARQAAITTEIIEVVSGAEAL
ncbi:MAG: ATP synthase F1 subunit gamma [Alphaproteobacteria bacterium]|nr:ATP synthase F1 subunit gamma [Alphaproteobacteria bacterium]